MGRRGRRCFGSRIVATASRPAGARGTRSGSDPAASSPSATAALSTSSKPLTDGVSESRPTLDFSVFEGNAAARDDLTLFRIEGFAADGVAAVGILNRAGHVALRVPIADNVYVLSHVPPGLSGVVVALDQDGTVISGPDH
jgi:hypothetical protein